MYLVSGLSSVLSIFKRELNSQYFCLFVLANSLSESILKCIVVERHDENPVLFAEKCPVVEEQCSNRQKFS